MAGPPIAFVAYSSRDAALAQLLPDAVYVANGNNDRVRYEPWVYNDIPGNPIISPILDRIGESAFVVADITTLNLNVVYEIGFTIGSRKRASERISSDIRKLWATRLWHMRPVSSTPLAITSTPTRTIWFGG
jgi:hypothetical protein